MSTFTYKAVDQHGKETKGTLQVANQNEAIQRIKEMGFYPTRVTELKPSSSPAERARRHAQRLGLTSKSVNHQVQISSTRTSRREFLAKFQIPFLRARVKTKQLCIFTRQLSTALDAGMPLLRCLRLLEEQETNPSFKNIITGVGSSIEGGCTFSEALAQHPRVFNHLYLSMVRAGELSGSLEITLKRLSDFTEKTEKIKRKVIAALFYPAAVISVATGVMGIMLLYVIPKFKAVFEGMMNGKPLPAFTRLVLGISDSIRSHFVLTAAIAAAVYGILLLSLRTRVGRNVFDRFKLKMPILGTLFSKVAIARFTRTLGTLTTTGVPILQSLDIVKETTGNVILRDAVEHVHDNVKNGESIAAPLRQASVFPVMVVGMIDVGEQTGALPEMLNKIADNYDEEVDNSVSALMSLIEPVMIVFLAVVVGSIVIAMFLPIIYLINDGGIGSGPGDGGV
ncbi:type II secretion system F family protein [Pedosphaera parvula]|uniref:General secretion pathway protein F n=1 Tax=Pedosphaera parvula (strain Ellin514) TaxID=320771 RepID=B9XEX6_PEDPL|nr:type II secretion system F family protein [Pedosphaera parvula]EEF61474.1 type II secretion system protein [Pedosphaera parvula Ellin514]